MSQPNSHIEDDGAEVVNLAGPLLMLTGLALGLMVVVEALELLSVIQWSQKANLALGAAGLSVYAAGFLLDVFKKSGDSSGHAAGQDQIDDLRSLNSLRKVARAATFLFLMAAFVGLKWVIMDYDPGKLFPDTLSYVQVAQSDLFSSEFWAGQRPFTLPLLYKFIGVTAENYKRPEVMASVANWQYALSTIAWLLLGSASATVMRRRSLSLLAFAGVLGFGLSLHVSQWDALMISESLSTSLFAAGLGWAVLGLASAHVLKRGSFLRRLGYCLVLVLLLTGFSFSRDSNVVVVGATVAGLGAYGWVGWRRGEWWAHWPLAVAAILALSCFLQLRSIQHGERWQVPFYHVLQDRILPNEEARAFFTQRGLPQGEPLDVLLTLDRNGFVNSLQANDRYQHIEAWIREDGRSAYLGYLMRRPVQVLVTPLRERDTLLNPLSTEYRHQEAVTPTWLHLSTSIAFPRSTLVLAVVFGACLLVMVHLARDLGLQWRWAIPLGLIVTSYPLMLLAWYGDSIEIERHAYQAAMQFRLGLLLLALFLLDAESRILASRLVSIEASQ